jgi:hypothetical protein
LADDVLGLTLHDNVETTDGEGFFAERPHLRPATDDFNLWVIFSGLSSYLITTGSLIDKRRDHQKIYAFQILVGVDYTASVFEPDISLVEVFTFPLSEGSREKQHPLAGNRDVFKISTGGRRL